MTTKVSPSLLRQPFRKNAIINGCMSVWQRTTSYASINNGQYVADRWKYNLGGTTAVHGASRSTDVPSLALAGRLFNYSALLDCTTADAAIAAADFISLEQKIEGYNWLPLAQRACVFSFYVKATKTGIYCVSFKNTGNDQCYVAEYTVSASDTWEKKTISLPASPSSGTWDYVNGEGLKVSFVLAAGTNYHGTAGAWTTSNILSSANQVNGVDDVANNFRITGVQLEVGSEATEFDGRTIQDELALCQRYYFSLKWSMSGYLDAALRRIACTTVHPVEMRATPTVTRVTTGSSANIRGADPATYVTVAVHNERSSRLSCESNAAGITSCDDFVDGLSAEL
jgi:hypothetical protein